MLGLKRAAWAGSDHALVKRVSDEGPMTNPPQGWKAPTPPPGMDDAKRQRVETGGGAGSGPGPGIGSGMAASRQLPKGAAELPGGGQAGARSPSAMGMGPGSLVNAVYVSQQGAGGGVGPPRGPAGGPAKPSPPAKPAQKPVVHVRGPTTSGSGDNWFSIVTS